MHRDNPRGYTPLHRAVIAGNYNAIRMILSSPLLHKTHLFKKVLNE